MSGEILRLPDEPPAGTIVEAVDGTSSWIHHERVGLDPSLPRWMQIGTPRPNWTTWDWVMKHTAPDGVRVLPEHEWIGYVLADYGSVTDL